MKVFRSGESLQTEFEQAIKDREMEVAINHESIAQATSLAENIESSLSIRKKLSLPNKLSFSKKASISREHRGKIITARQVRSPLEELNELRTVKAQVVGYLLEVTSLYAEQNRGSSRVPLLEQRDGWPLRCFCS